MKRAFLADQRIQVDAHRESEFYASQSELLGNILRFLAIMITSIMAVGAVFGAVNTMYAAVSSRTPEIAVLLTLGFHPRSVLASFLAESAVIAFVGGVIGLPAGAADQRRGHEHDELGELQRDRVRVPRDAAAAAGRDRVRGGDGRGRRILPGAAGEPDAGDSGVAVTH